MDNTIGELSASTYLIRYWQQFIHGSKKETERTKKLLFDWYSQMNPEVFSKKYPLNDGKVIGNNPEELANLHYEWVEQNEINRTPTFFINGYKMPQNYRIKDLMEMIPGLKAEWKNSNMTMQGTKKEIA
jgi:hypothetical protein